ncbi:MAG: histidine kinase, partial [Desulfobacteraceae bacterium]|nr:histidine kinase [Desulfobacteraceae bacterium]
DYITKPFSPSLVQARVRNRLNMIRAQRRQQASAHDDKMITVGSLAIGMAHEINNPLAGMMQNAQLINNRLTKNIPANEEAAKKAGVTMDGIRKYVQERRIVQQLERINESGIQAAKIVEKILEFSIEEKSAMIKEDLASIIDDALSKTFEDSTIKQIQDLHLIDIQKEYTSKPTQVLSDKRKLTMAFSNIFKNAIQAMQKNSSVYPGAILQINIVNNNKSLVVIIEDNGTGMDEEIKKQVFDPLFSTREVGMGAGLDLAMVFFIITQTHKGLINVSSALGKGSKFIIELPFIF